MTSARTPLARSTLMAPFYVQCLPAAVYALVVGLGFLIEQRPGGGAVGWSLVGAAGLWYLADRVWQFERPYLTVGTALYTDRYVKVDGRWLIRETRYRRIYEIGTKLDAPPKPSARPRSQLVTRSTIRRRPCCCDSSGARVGAA